MERGRAGKEDRERSGLTNSNTPGKTGRFRSRCHASYHAAGVSE
jgi:hypothetical protein